MATIVALFERSDIPDGYGDRLVIDAGERLVQCGLVVPAHVVPDADRGV